MNGRSGLLALFCVFVGVIGLVAVAAISYRIESSNKTSNTAVTKEANSRTPQTPRARTTDACSGRASERPDGPPAERVHAVGAGDEPERSESRLTTEWDEMNSQQRSDEAIAE